MKKILDFLCSIGIHFWQYGNPRKGENPYRRTCRHCGKSQSFYVPSWDYWAFDKNGEAICDAEGQQMVRPYNNRNGWWE